MMADALDEEVDYSAADQQTEREREDGELKPREVEGIRSGIALAHDDGLVLDYLLGNGSVGDTGVSFRPGRAVVILWEPMRCADGLPAVVAFPRTVFYLPALDATRHARAVGAVPDRPSDQPTVQEVSG
jgi:hypothetical protein